MNLVALLKLKLLIKIENKIAKTNSVADGVPAILHSHCSQKLAAPLLISYICYLFYLEIKSLEDKLDISLLSGIRELGIGVQERFTCDIILQPLGGHSILDPC